MEQQSPLNPPNMQAMKKKGHAQPIDVAIGERLKELRKLKSLTQEDLAERLGVSFQQVQKYENGKNRISFSRLYDLSQFMNIPMESFVANINAQAHGLHDNLQEQLTPPTDSVSEKETAELLKIYYSLENPKLRKTLLKFIRTMAEDLKG